MTCQICSPSPLLLPVGLWLTNKTRLSLGVNNILIICNKNIIFFHKKTKGVVFTICRGITLVIVLLDNTEVSVTDNSPNLSSLTGKLKTGIPDWWVVLISGSDSVTQPFPSVLWLCHLQQVASKVIAGGKEPGTFLGTMPGNCVHSFHLFTGHNSVSGLHSVTREAGKCRPALCPGRSGWVTASQS